MDYTSPDSTVFFHIRVIIGVVTGLAITRLLNGLASLVSSPERGRAYSVHIAWALLLLLMIVHFWWFQFSLGRVSQWTFETYTFLIFYAALHFFAAAVLFPDRSLAPDDFETYFHDHRPWFYGLLITLLAVDMIDTALKGMDHFQSLGIEYPVRQGLLIFLALCAIPIADRRYHIAFVAFAFVVEVWWIATRYYVLS